MQGQKKIEDEILVGARAKEGKKKNFISHINTETEVLKKGLHSFMD